MRLLIAVMISVLTTGASANPWVSLSDEPDRFGSLKAYVWDDDARGVLMYSCQHDTVVYSVTVDRYRDWDPAQHEGVTVPVTFRAGDATVVDIPFYYWNQEGLATLRFDNTTEVFDDLVDLLQGATDRIHVEFGALELDVSSEDKDAAMTFVDEGCNSLEWQPDGF